MKKETLTEIIKETEFLSKNILGEKLDRGLIFGSVARGDFDSDSDIDIEVFPNLEETELKNYYDKISLTSAEVSVKYGILISILLISNKTFQAYKDVLPLYRNLIREGREYYG